MLIAAWHALTILGIAAFISACIRSENGPSPQERFILKIEQKYKREAYRNDIDLHFVPVGSDGLKIVATYKNGASVDLATNIANGAIELVRGLKAQDPTVKDLDLTIDKEVRPRD